MKKLMALVLAFVFIATMGLAGCGKKAATDTTAPATEAKQEETKKEEPKQEEKKVTVKFLGYNSEDSRKTYLESLKTKFPNITVEFQYVDQKQNAAVLNTQLAAGQGPDLIEGGGNTTTLANAGYLEDLTNAPFTGKYSETGLKPYIFKDKIYGVPLQSWFEAIFYNKTIFDKYGLKPPKTFDEFIAIHETLKKNGVKPQTMGAKSWEPMMKQPMLMLDNEFYSTDAGKGFDEAFAAGTRTLDGNYNEALNKWSEVISKGCLTKDMLGLDYDQALNEFATEKAAMWECGPWAVQTMLKANPNLKFGMFPFPGTKGGPGWAVGGPGSSLCVNAKSPVKDAVMQILDYTATPEAQKALIKDNFGSSFLKGVEIDLAPEYADMAECFKANNVYAPWVYWFGGDAIAMEFGKNIQEVLSGKKSIDDAIKATDKKANDMRKAQK